MSYPSKEQLDETWVLIDMLLPGHIEIIHFSSISKQLFAQVICRTSTHREKVLEAMHALLPDLKTLTVGYVRSFDALLSNPEKQGGDTDHSQFHSDAHA